MKTAILIRSLNSGSVYLAPPESISPAGRVTGRVSRLSGARKGWVNVHLIRKEYIILKLKCPMAEEKYHDIQS